MTRQYLKEWGANWQKDAPQDFVYLDRFQSELFPEGNQRVVILSQVLPANSTIGYDDFTYLVVTKVNGKEIKSLADLAEAVKTARQWLSYDRDGGRPETNRARCFAGGRRGGSLAKELRPASHGTLAVNELPISES